MVGNSQKNSFASQLKKYYSSNTKDERYLEEIFCKNKPDFVLSDGTETALIIGFDSKTMSAPKIFEKGKNGFAKKIETIAHERSVPVIKDACLANNIFNDISTGSEVPEQYYSAFAVILAYVPEISAEINEGKNTQIITRKSEIESPIAFSANKNSDGSTICDECERLRLEIGKSLFHLINRKIGAPLLERITEKRKQFKREWGIDIPSIHIVDNPNLQHNEYALNINGIKMGGACINMYLCLNSGDAEGKVHGKKTKDPAFELPAYWISEKDVEKAKKAGYGVYDPVRVISAHIFALCKRHVCELIGRDEVKGLIDGVQRSYPMVVDDLLKYYTFGEIKLILHGLLRESVSIRNLVPIFETLADYGTKTHDISVLIEKVRVTLGRQICLQYTDDNRLLHCITLNSDLESYLMNEYKDESSYLNPELRKQLYHELSEQYKHIIDKGYSPIVLCSQIVRRFLRKEIDQIFPDLAVLAILEVPPDINVSSELKPISISISD